LAGELIVRTGACPNEQPTNLSRNYFSVDVFSEDHYSETEFAATDDSAAFAIVFGRLTIRPASRIL